MVRHRVCVLLSSWVLTGCPDSGPPEESAGRASAQYTSPNASSTGGVAGTNSADTSGGAVAPAPPSPTRRRPTAPRASPPFEGTIGVLESTAAGPPRVLRDVRAARHSGYDRMVFEFGEGVPGYHLEYIDHPVRACGSGDVVPMSGEGWLQVRLSPAHAHDEGGKPTLFPPGREVGLPNLREFERTCDFEAVTTYVLAMNSPTPFRILTLDDPPRLVVDVLHPTSPSRAAPLN